MKLPAHVYLDERNIPYQRKSFPPETEKGAANVARVLGFSERQAVKTLIFEVHTGERVLVMLGGDQSAVSGHLKKAIGSRNIKMANPEVVKETTGYVIGSIPAFGWQPHGFRPRSASTSARALVRASASSGMLFVLLWFLVILARALSRVPGRTERDTAGTAEESPVPL